MNIRLPFFTIFLLFSSQFLLAQRPPSQQSGVAVKTYFLKGKKIMESHYDQQDRLTFEWCNRPDLLTKQPMPYIEFYRYEGREITITRYPAKLKKERQVVFDDPSYPRVSITTRIDGRFVSRVTGDFDVQSRYFIDEIAKAKVKFRPQPYFNGASLLIKPDSLQRKDSVPYLYPDGPHGVRRIRPMDLMHPQPKEVNYFDEKGRLIKTEELIARDFTFSESPVYKINMIYVYIYNDPENEQIHIIDRHSVKKYKILVRNKYH